MVRSKELMPKKKKKGKSCIHGVDTPAIVITFNPYYYKGQLKPTNI